MKPIFFTFPLVIYPFDVVVSLGQSYEQCRKLMVRKGVTEDIDFVDYDGGAGKYAVWYCHSIALIRIPGLPYTPSQHGALNHEILHVVISVLRGVGIRIEPGAGSDEAFTYLMSYMTKVIFTRLDKYYKNCNCSK